jgi:hypothetical protein
VKSCCVVMCVGVVALVGMWGQVGSFALPVLLPPASAQCPGCGGAARGAGFSVKDFAELNVKPA